MGESLLTTLSMENHHPSTLLSMDPAGARPSSTVSPHDDGKRELLISSAPDINIPVSVEQSPSPQHWCSDAYDMLDVGLGHHPLESEFAFSLPKPTAGSSNGSFGARKCAKRSDSIWSAWFFFNFYFKPVFLEKFKGKYNRDTSGLSGFDKSDLRLDVFLVQHDMENMYMWVFKERPENALGKMQLRSYMNGHSRHGEPSFPFCADKGFVRSHRMQRKHYRGLSNPQCLHGIEVVSAPNLSGLPETDRKRWVELTGRDLDFSIPLEASDFETWRNLPSMDFDLEKPALPPPPLALKVSSHAPQRRTPNGSCLNLSTQPSNHSSSELTDLSPKCSKRRKDCSPQGMDGDAWVQDAKTHSGELSWVNDFTGVMRLASGPVTASKTIYEDEEGYLIVVSMPFADLQRVKVSWRNTLVHGIVKISCVSTGRMPCIKRHGRMFKLTDPSPEHCASGEFVREIALATRIPEDAKLEAYYDDSGTGLEIMVPKHRVGPEEHEVRVCIRPPHLGDSELQLT